MISVGRRPPGNKDTVEITIQNNDEQEIVFAVGRICSFQDMKIIIIQNRNYDGYFLFRIHAPKREILFSFFGITMNFLSYEDAGKVAIELFKSDIRKYTMTHIHIITT